MGSLQSDKSFAAASTAGLRTAPAGEICKYAKSGASPGRAGARGTCNRGLALMPPSQFAAIRPEAHALPARGSRSPDPTTSYGQTASVDGYQR